MRKFCLKALAALAFAGLLCAVNCYFDTFNVFHWKNIRITGASSNANFIKTKYILSEKKKFNAFIFGSSRVGDIPQDKLPAERDGVPLRWYNMTYPLGTPSEQYLTLETFLKNGVQVEMVLLGFDELAMYQSIEEHKSELARLPYQMYEENKFSFYKNYVQKTVPLSIAKQILKYNEKEHEEERDFFYSYGGIPLTFVVDEDPRPERFEPICTVEYLKKEAPKDILNIAALCKERGIELILFTNPLYKSTYLEAVKGGYFDFLKDVAQGCEFYNFSSLNNYTTDTRYYFESTHYRPILGLALEEFLFGSEAEREKIKSAAGDGLFGQKINSKNVDEIVKRLEAQLD